ncbi:hypothetical protein NKH14_13460 [Mesorhizobium sp. M1380]|uniref:hypothetical protein n=1 Tax=Mesorhizobium sp. M1380 TaxID=2957093 RepID=UPI00333B1EEA
MAEASVAPRPNCNARRRETPNAGVTQIMASSQKPAGIKRFGTSAPNFTKGGMFLKLCNLNDLARWPQSKISATKMSWQTTRQNI